MLSRVVFPRLFSVLVCLVILNDWRVLSPSINKPYGRSYVSVFASAASSSSSRKTQEDEETSPSSTGGALETADEDRMTFSEILTKAGKKGLGGGVPGAIAGVVQVFTLMSLRTIINYQMRYGTSFRKAVDVLYKVSWLLRNQQ